MQFSPNLSCLEKRDSYVCPWYFIASLIILNIFDNSCLFRIVCGFLDNTLIKSRNFYIKLKILFYYSLRVIFEMRDYFQK